MREALRRLLKILLKMNTIHRNILWVPFVSLFHREMKRVLRTVVQTVLVPVINSSLYLFIFGVHLGKKLDISDGMNYLSFLIPGVIMMGCLTQSAMNTISSIMHLKYAGELQDLKVAPLMTIQIVLAFSLAAALRGILVGLCLFFVGQLIYFSQEGIFLSLKHPLLALLFSFLGALFFAHLGIVIAFCSKTLEQVGAITGFVMQPLIYLGGVFYSIDNLQGFWKSLSELNPVIYVINGLRYAFLGKSDFSLQVSFAWSLILLAVLFIIAYISVQKSSYMRSV